MLVALPWYKLPCVSTQENKYWDEYENSASEHARKVLRSQRRRWGNNLRRSVRSYARNERGTGRFLNPMHYRVRGSLEESIVSRVYAAMLSATHRNWREGIDQASLAEAELLNDETTIADLAPLTDGTGPTTAPVDTQPPPLMPSSPYAGGLLMLAAPRPLSPLLYGPLSPTPVLHDSSDLPTMDFLSQQPSSALNDSRLASADSFSWAMPPYETEHLSSLPYTVFQHASPFLEPNDVRPFQWGVQPSFDSYTGSPRHEQAYQCTVTFYTRQPPAALSPPVYEPHFEYAGVVSPPAPAEPLTAPPTYMPAPFSEPPRVFAVPEAPQPHPEHAICVDFD
jgi:hypothetical protein